MNIEQDINILKQLIREYKRKPETQNEFFIGLIEEKALENLLIAYEKEKGENVKLRLQDIPLIEGELKAYKDRVNELKQELEKEKEKNKKIEIIVNKLMPLAECSYWNYENHTCTHTCRGCDDLNEYNKRTASGIIIDKDRYCRLYEDGHIQEDTKFVSVEDLINRHLKEE